MGRVRDHQPPVITVKHPPYSIGQGVEDKNNEVSQDAIWDAVEKEELEYKELLPASKTDNRRWKGSDRPTSEGNSSTKLNQGRCEADAAVAEDVEKEQEENQLGHKLMRDLNCPNSETWERIDEEVQKWRN